MHYLRMLTNSLIAGALVGAYVALLVLQLNPMVRLDSMAAARLMLTWAAFYGVHAAAFFYGLIVLRQLFAVEVRPPGWISLRLLAAFGTMAVSMSAIFTWLNLDGFRSVLGPDGCGAHDRWRARSVVVRGRCVSLALVQSRLQRGPVDRCDGLRARARRVARRSAVPSGSGRFHAASAHPGRRAACARAVERPRAHDSARRRIARLHRAERRGRPVSALRPPARQRGGDASRDAPPDAAGACVDGRRHREAAVQDERLFGGALCRAGIGSAAGSASRFLLRAGARASRAD